MEHIMNKFNIPTEIVNIIENYAYEPKRYSVFEGDNIYDYLETANEHDIVSYETNNQMGCVDYEVVVNEDGEKEFKVIWSMEDEC
tara:strand:- start:884 stop:1138 length:255 start_codon:yes stop_codon:yes gene_type:complete